MKSAVSPAIVRDLVLLGGGHSHVAVLKRFGMRPVPGVRITLVSRGVETPYSGMVPGLIAGHYTRDEAHIDLQRLGRFAGARLVFEEAIGLDLNARQVLVHGRPPIAYDLLSIDIGSTPVMSVPGSADHAIAVKPIDGLLDRWEAVRARLDAGAELRRVAVVGGGAGGVELLLAVQYRMRTSLAEQGRQDAHLEYHLFSRSDTILPTHNPRVRRIFARILNERGVTVHTGHAVTEVFAGGLRTADGSDHAADEILWTTQAGAAPWLAASGLAVDEHGFVRVSSSLQSVSHSEVFAAGDVASMVEHPRPKSGVIAVRQGGPLGRNLRRALFGARLTTYRPQGKFLSLISTGDRYAVASRGALALEGAWLWRLKDRIDRRFMRRYSHLPEMETPQAPTPETASSQAALTRSVPPWTLEATMRCGGCGAKVGASVLARALARVGTSDVPGVMIGLGTPDDAAVMDLGGETVVVHTVDFFRAMIDDPYVFGQIAANHAMGDVYAMGGEPRSALAIVTIPPGPDAKVEETLVQLMAGARLILDDAGATLAGGHTAEGAELALGFAVHGLVPRQRILRKGGLRPGDRLLLTKPIGTGTLFAADMRHMARGQWMAAALASMLQSNREAVRCLLAHGVTACTDVTGFGLIGHLLEMLRASAVHADIDLEAVPVLAGAEETAGAGILSSLQSENASVRQMVEEGAGVGGHPRFPLIFDPQTAGGLLAGLPADRAEACVTALCALGYARSAIIGTLRPRSERPGLVRVKV